MHRRTGELAAQTGRPSHRPLGRLLRQAGDRIDILVRAELVFVERPDVIRCLAEKAGHGESVKRGQHHSVRRRGSSSLTVRVAFPYDPRGVFQALPLPTWV